MAKIKKQKGRGAVSERSPKDATKTSPVSGKAQRKGSARGR